jgi:hypothetical protein
MPSTVKFNIISLSTFPTLYYLYIIYFPSSLFTVWDTPVIAFIIFPPLWCFYLTHLFSFNMLDEKAAWLSEDKLEDTCPPPYMSDSGLGDDFEWLEPSPKSESVQHNDTKVQPRGKKVVRAALAFRGGHYAESSQASISRRSTSEIHPATAANKGDGHLKVEKVLPRYRHNSMMCGHGTISTRVPLPLATPPFG